MKPIYDFENKSGHSKEKFLSNEWSKNKFYKKKYGTYQLYLAALGDQPKLNECTKIWSWS